MQKIAPFILFFFLLIGSTAKADVKDSTATDSIRKDAIRLFIDCSSCDVSYLKKNITFVNYVRDTKDAQVHLMVTVNQTGSGGYEYELYFIGQNEFKGIDDTLKMIVPSNSTSDETRTLLNKNIKIGLIRYVSKTPLINFINIDYDHPESADSKVEDKWNSWVFSISTTGNYNAQTSSSSLYLNSSITANRTTEASKLNFSLGSNFYEQRFKMDDEEIIGISRSYYFSNVYAKSLNQHWSIGEYMNVSNSTYSNLDFAFSFKPAIEFNIFPYSEYNRRKFCFNYSIGVNYRDFIDTTIFFKTKATFGSHTLSAYYQTIQKWGSIYLSLDGSTFLDDFSKNRLDLYTSIEWRVFKGLALSYSMSYGFIHDQIGIAKGEASREDVLLSLRQIQTDYTLYAYFSLSYTFGSMYNNVVNPRF